MLDAHRCAICVIVLLLLVIVIVLVVQGGGVVSGRKVVPRDCYIKAIEVIVKQSKWDARSWRNLGLVGGGPVSGQKYSKTQCYVKVSP